MSALIVVRKPVYAAKLLKVFKTPCIWIRGGMSIELQRNLSKGKNGNISSDELTDCARSVDAKISRAGEAKP
ncbi:hypothetical protein F511_09411 [Dorcoceras hygrometricum]|uniref:Uncharacterized protein n=1 Tax=Dorcoceras hygrometricum TaxID=472368 RepID=A0A2Z7BB27_9LAMI|nr:hypothetical protein F511_09411 [Dorcoceras hygrometricum]